MDATEGREVPRGFAGGGMSGAVLHFCAARYGRGVLLVRALRGTERGG